MSKVANTHFRDLTSLIVRQDSLVSLHLTYINLDDAQIVENLCDVQTLRCFSDLNLSWASLRAKYLYQISRVLSTRLLKNLDLSYNNINTNVIRDAKKKPPVNKKKKPVVEEPTIPAFDVSFAENIGELISNSECLNHINLSGMGL